MKALILILALLWGSYAVPIGTKCYGDIYCGSKLDLEKLICSDDDSWGQCLGKNLNNKCNNGVCYAGYFCDKGVCNACISGCAVCTDATSCTTPMPYFYLNANNKPTPLPANCLTGSVDGCSASGCEPGYFYDTTAKACAKCPASCISCSSATTCGICNTGMFWDTANSRCANGISNCDSPIDATTCQRCAAGYYLYTDKDGKQSCKQGPAKCRDVYPLGACKTCKVLGVNGHSGSTSYYLKTDAIECSAMGTPYCILTTNGKDCKACLTTYFLDKLCNTAITGCTTADDIGTCSQCATGYYPTAAKGCSPCIAGCSKCTGPSKAECQACYDGYLFGNYNCEKCITGCNDCSTGKTICNTCGSGYYKDTNNICQPCITGGNCATCDANGCLTCPGTSGNQLGYYLDTADKKCKNCIAACKTCTITDPATCTGDCFDGYYKDTTTVSGKTICTACTSGYNCKTCSSATACATCPEGKYKNADNKCLNDCTSGCANCETSASSTACDTCKPGFAKLVDNTCAACTSANCDTCGNTAAGACTQCKAGYGIMTADTNNPKACELCKVAGCKNCNTDSTYCETANDCDTGYYGSTITVDGASKATCTACVAGGNCATCDASGCLTCPAGYWKDTADGNKCKAGPANCATATATEACTTCKTGYQKFYDTPCPACEAGCAQCSVALSSGTGKCSKCLPGYHGPTNGVCTKCGSDAQCNSCSDATTCNGCKTGFVLNGATCSQCPNGCNVCNVADLGTSTCNGACKDGYYKDKDNKCQPCSTTANVATCAEPPKDSTGAYISGSTTQIKTCVAGSYASDVCTSAISGCKTFLSPNKCKECVDGYYLDNYVCTACTSPCAKCTKSSTGTVTCSLCQAGYYYDTATSSCKNCIDGCAVCTTGTSCTTCKPKYYATGSTCTACGANQGPLDCNCPANYFWDKTSTDCSKCPDGCSVCSTSDTCTTCFSNFYMDNGVCKAALGNNCDTAHPMGTCRTCIASAYYRATDNTCNDCSIIPNCLTCDSNTKCTTCATGYFVDGGNCTACPTNLTNCDACSSATLCDQCKTGYYWNTTTLKCDACMSGCTACSNPTNCMRCGPGFRSDANFICQTCIAGCKTCSGIDTCDVCMDGYFLDTNKKCTPCHPLCATCTNSTETTCTSCIGNATLTGTTCKCDPNFMFDTTNKKCVSGDVSSSAVYVFTGLLTLLVALLAIF